jgi:hypothetical protein
LRRCPACNTWKHKERFKVCGDGRLERDCMSCRQIRRGNRERQRAAAKLASVDIDAVHYMRQEKKP